MSADLAAYTADPAGLDRLDRQSVVALLERGKTWLTMAVQRDTEVGDLVEFKGQAETVRVYTVQKQLGKDAELAASELVRRAERGIGLAIEAGQARGEIAKPGDIGGTPAPGGRGGVLPDGLRGEHLQRPSDLVDKSELRNRIYPLTRGVSDEQFETAIDEAKSEGNLSGKNVVRKVANKPAPKSKRPEVLRKTRRIDSHRVIAATVDTAAANVITPDLLAEIDLSELETHDLGEWISSLSESIRALTSLKTTLKKELSQRG